MRKPRAVRAAEVRERYPARAERQRQIVAKHRELYPERSRAHKAVAHALKTGKLTKGPCADCGRGDVKVHAHHEDYAKPLDVVWLCVACHRLRHTKGPRRRIPLPILHPSRFKLTQTPRGWVAKIDGKTTWICSKRVAPTVAEADAYFEQHFPGKR